jgi:hypothetical protein
VECLRSTRRRMLNSEVTSYRLYQSGGTRCKGFLRGHMIREEPRQLDRVLVWSATMQRFAMDRIRKSSIQVFSHECTGVSPKLREFVSRSTLSYLSKQSALPLLLWNSPVWFSKQTGCHGNDGCPVLSCLYMLASPRQVRTHGNM